MSCSPVTGKDMVKMENPRVETSVRVDEGYKKLGFKSACSTPKQVTASMKPLEDMSQTFRLFRKYLLMKAQHNTGKTFEHESQAIVNKSPSPPLIPPRFSGGFRQSSFLKQRLFPGIKRDAMVPTANDQDKSATAQLTIFYSGAVSVYDNVPIEKVQAIMHLAGDNSTSAPAAKNTSDIVPKSQPLPPTLPSVCELQAGLPIARKHSLQRFLEKRRDRMKEKSPYASSSMRGDDEETAGDKERSILVSHFPSPLGCFSIASSR